MSLLTVQYKDSWVVYFRLSFGLKFTYDFAMRQFELCCPTCSREAPDSFVRYRTFYSYTKGQDIKTDLNNPSSGQLRCGFCQQASSVDPPATVPAPTPAELSRSEQLQETLMLWIAAHLDYYEAILASRTVADAVANFLEREQMVKTRRPRWWWWTRLVWAKPRVYSLLD